MRLRDPLAAGKDVVRPVAAEVALGDGLAAKVDVLGDIGVSARVLADAIAGGVIGIRPADGVGDLVLAVVGVGAVAHHVAIGVIDVSGGDHLILGVEGDVESERARLLQASPRK